MKNDVKILLRNVLLYIFWMILILVVREVYSENIWNNWEYYEVPDHVPKQIVIDRENRKWVVCSIGVRVYDGEQWVKYSQSNSGLPYYSINCLRVDSENNMWFGTDKGAARFDGETWEVFDTYTSGLAADRVTDIAFDSNGGIWFTSGNTITHFNGSEWIEYSVDEGFREAITCITLDKDYVWFGTYKNGIRRFDGDSWRTYNYDNSGIVSNLVTTVAVTPDDKLLIGTMSGLSEFDGLHWKSWRSGRESGISGGDVLAIEFDNKGLVWIATEFGFSCYAGELWASFPSYTIPVIEDESSDNHKVRDLAVDSENTIWLVTNKGLYHFTPEFIQATGSCEGKIFESGDTIEFSWLAAHVEEMKIEYTINNGETWLEIASAVHNVEKNYSYTLPYDIIPPGYYSIKMTFRISSAETPELYDEISLYVEEKNLRELFVSFAPTNSGLISKNISSIYEDTHGVIWFGTDKGISCYNGFEWTTFTSGNSGLVSNTISEIFKGRNGTLWFKTDMGISGYNGSEWTTFTPENSGLISNYVNNMASTPDGSLWFATPDGLSQFDGKTWKTWFEGVSIVYLAVGRNGRVFTLFHRFDSETQKAACRWHSPHTWEIVSYDGEKWVRDAEEYSSINVLGTDPDGFLWFNAFDDKTIKYDGISWSVNECPPDMFWLHSGIGGCFTWGCDGTLWVHNNESLNYFDGRQWKNYPLPPSFYPGSMDVASDGSVWCVDYNDGFAVFDGANWKTYLRENGCRLYEIKTIFVDSHNVKWIACSEGLIRFDDGATIPIKVENSPTEITLMRNYPNPFNNATTISFSLPSSGFAKLVIYTVMGQKVRTLLADNHMAGTYSVVWDGRDDKGVTVSSGIYISSLKTGSTSWAGKMLLVK